MLELLKKIILRKEVESLRSKSAESAQRVDLEDALLTKALFEWSSDLERDAREHLADGHLWSRIEGQMLSQVSKKHDSGFLGDFRQWLFDTFSGVSRPYAFGGSLALAALLLLIVSFQQDMQRDLGQQHQAGYRNEVLPGQALDVASLNPSSESSRLLFVKDLFVDARQGADFARAYSEAKEPWTRTLSSPSDSWQIPGGLRADNLNIEWIKAKRPLRLVSSRGNKAPPVIWVSNNRR